MHCEAYRTKFFSATFDGDFEKGLELKQTFSDWVETSKLPIMELIPMELLLQKLPGWLQNRVRTSEPTDFEDFLGKVQIDKSTTTSSARGKLRWMEYSTEQSAEGKSGAKDKEEVKLAEPKRTIEARCFKCNQKGHLRRDCPQKLKKRETSVHRMDAGGPSKHLLVDVKVNGRHQVKAFLNTGADKTVVHRQLVNKKDLNGQTMTVQTAISEAKLPVARIYIEI